MSIGARLKEERERLAMSQEALAALGNASKRSQIDWEKGVSFPNASYLAAIAAYGVDVRFVVTGTRESAALPAEEQRLLGLFRLADASVRQAVLRALATGEEPPKSAKLAHLPQVTIHGDVGQKIDGPLVISGDQHFTMGAAPAKRGRKPRGG